MTRRETALTGLLLVAACSIDNPTFVLLTEATTTTTVATTDLPTTTTQSSDPTTGDPGTSTTLTSNDTTDTTDTNDTTGPTGTTGPVSATDITGMTDSTTGQTSETTDTTGDGTTGDSPDLPNCDQANTSLLACYDFEYMMGEVPTQLLDGSKYGHHGLINTAQVVPGIEGTALKIVETTEINVTSDNTFAYPEQAVTLAAWVQPSALPQIGKYIGILDKGPDYSLGISAELGVACRIGGGSIEVDKKPMVKAWTHIACVFNVNEFALYIDGAKKETYVINDVELAPTMAPLLIGCGDPACGAASRFTGAIDGVRIWNVALEPAVICGLAGSVNC